MKTIIAGGREFNDPQILQNWCKDAGITEVVSGAARGADKLGEAFASFMSFPVKLFPADWEKHGKAAGHIRNREMAEYADQAIVFWDGESRGTKNMIETMRKLKKPVTVVHYYP